MYLKALEIQGFKSFPDKTRLNFDQEITAIVGPNGSGKSNISDAILWVMGEQRTKTLRGGKMEDVIFGGTEKRSPMGFAQVSLILDNSTGIFDTENTEVMITRRYYRSGESEYYINREACRLRDINELLMDIDELEFRLSRLQLLGSKGTTGTQASFLELFGGDGGKIQEMERLIADEMGFAGVVPVSGQTYSRKVDSYFLSALSGIAQSAMKFANDLRIAQSFEELEEPFEKHQIGSSAMPYKRNPMRSERMCALARYVMTDSLNPAFTAGTQWFERTLDDSANKRLSVAEAFLATDAILNIYMNITEGIVVYERVIARRVMEKLPFMATENILMESVKRGGDRQELHEALRVHSHAAAARVKLEGGQNDLLDRIAADPLFPLSREELEEMLDPRAFIGCCPSQVTHFLKDTVQPVVDRWGAKETLTAKLEV